MRPFRCAQNCAKRRFQSTHSLRSATTGCGSSTGSPVVSIHALLAECDCASRSCALVNAVSIHALLAECDGRHAFPGGPPGGFNPRTPCGVRRKESEKEPFITWFQSTHSLRSATPSGTLELYGFIVSIHALLAECDSAPGRTQYRCGMFQSTHSLRSATGRGGRGRRAAARFNPRTPCGVRPRARMEAAAMCLFQSTHSLRSATEIYAAETTRNWFQSTHSLRSATRGPGTGEQDDAVSIHALLAECDVAGVLGRGRPQVSIHALLAECDIP